MDKELARKAVARIWVILLPFDSPYERMDGYKDRDLKSALAGLSTALDGADRSVLHVAEELRMALLSGVLANPEGKPNRESVLRCCEALMGMLGEKNSDPS